MPNTAVHRKKNLYFGVYRCSGTSVQAAYKRKHVIGHIQYRLEKASRQTSKFLQKSYTYFRLQIACRFYVAVAHTTLFSGCLTCTGNLALKSLAQENEVEKQKLPSRSHYKRQQWISESAMGLDLIKWKRSDYSRHVFNIHRRGRIIVYFSSRAKDVCKIK